MSATRDVETPVSEPTVQPSTVRRRRLTVFGPVSLLVILLLLVAIAVVGDRVAEKVAAEQLRTRLVAAVDDHGIGYQSIDVEIGGFPFLTQVAAGRYDAITIDMTQVQLPTANGRAATLPNLHAVASGVNANTRDVVQGDANVVADRVNGTALVSFQTLQNVVDYSNYSLSNVAFSESGGAVHVTATANVAGQQIPLTATATINVVNGQLQVAFKDATAVGVPAPGLIRDYLDKLTAAQLAAHLPALPFGLKLTQVDVADNGLEVSAAGAKVPLTR
jgi:phage-related holin